MAIDHRPKYNVDSQAGQLGWFTSGEAWFHLDPAFCREAGVPFYLAACHEDSHRRLETTNFSMFQRFLAFAELCARETQAEACVQKVIALQTATVKASIYVQEGCATVNMLAACFPNYMRHFGRLLELFRSIEPYGTALRQYEILLGPMEMHQAALAKQIHDGWRNSLTGTAMRIASVLLDSEILDRYRAVDELTPIAFEDYLREQGPDARLQCWLSHWQESAPRDSLIEIYGRCAVTAADRHGRTIEGTPGSEPVEDLIALDCDAAFLKQLQDANALRFSVQPHALVDKSHAFPRSWFSSIERLVPVDRRLRASWLQSGFLYNLYKSTDIYPNAGPGRAFRQAMPAKMVARPKTGVPLYELIQAVADAAERLDLVFAISFVAIDRVDWAAAILSLWSYDPEHRDAQCQWSEAFLVDPTLSSRPPEAPSKRPWLVHADGYCAGSPYIQSFVRPNDVAFYSNSTLNTFQTAMQLDAVSAAGAVPVLWPVMIPPAEHLKNCVDMWVTSTRDVPTWPWCMQPGCLDAIELVILQRQTLTANQKRVRLLALERVIQAMDLKGGLAACADMQEHLPNVLDPLPEKSDALDMILTIGPLLVQMPERWLPTDTVVVPYSRLKPLDEKTTTFIEGIYKNWLPIAETEGV